MSMLRLDDRLRLAMQHDMSATLTADECKAVAGMIVTLDKVARGRDAQLMRRAAALALAAIGWKVAR